MTDSAVKIFKFQFDPLKIKSGPANSLVHRLSTLLGELNKLIKTLPVIHRNHFLLAACNSNYGGLRAVAQLWAEFTQEMRYRVERCIQIPG